VWGIPELKEACLSLQRNDAAYWGAASEEKMDRLRLLAGNCFVMKYVVPMCAMGAIAATSVTLSQGLPLGWVASASALDTFIRFILNGVAGVVVGAGSVLAGLLMANNLMYGKKGPVSLFQSLDSVKERRYWPAELVAQLRLLCESRGHCLHHRPLTKCAPAVLKAIHELSSGRGKRYMTWVVGERF